MYGRRNQDEKPQRVRYPRDGEVLGVVEQLHGFAKMRVKCSDGKIRNCRIPGRLTRHLWIRERDIVLIKPWEHSHETRGDVIFKYRRNIVPILKDKKLLGEIADEV
ncbi:MAG TPA: translation initiation factor IF-1A [Candidatus Woesearchaeota archaeon]|nr:translation initiation factor IF-1A [Candidatus Woesearchaeota archaeon]